jgi:hypothetical protein
MIDESRAPVVVTFEGQTFTIRVERVDAVGPTIPRSFEFWRVDQLGHAPYLGPRVTNDESPTFFEHLVAKMLWNRKLP